MRSRSSACSGSSGGELEVSIGDWTLRVPGFLVIAAIIYSSLDSGAMVYIARGFVPLAENKNQAEANYRYALTRLRENGESICSGATPKSAPPSSRRSPWSAGAGAR
jgi:ABC-type uncharacterized transport system fused permease/ATPase subunit